MLFFAFKVHCWSLTKRCAVQNKDHCSKLLSKGTRLLMALWFICRKVEQLLFAELHRLCRVIYSFLISEWVSGCTNQWTYLILQYPPFPLPQIESNSSSVGEKSRILLFHNCVQCVCRNKGNMQILWMKSDTVNTQHFQLRALATANLSSCCYHSFFNYVPWTVSMGLM